MIHKQRLSIEQILELEQFDEYRFAALEKICQNIEKDVIKSGKKKSIITCKAGRDSCYIDYKGTLKLCHYLDHPLCICSLLDTDIEKAWPKLLERSRKIYSDDKQYLSTCGECGLKAICSWCPAHSFIQYGKLDGVDQIECRLAHQRVSQFKKQ